METMTEAGLEKRIDDLRVDIDHRFDAVDKCFAAVDRRFDGIDGRFAAVDERFDRVEAHLIRIDERFERLYPLIAGSAVAVVAALLGVIATQL